MADFRERLAALGLSQAELRRWIEAVTGRRIAQSTTSRWASGDRRAPPELDALLAVIERPDLLRKLKR